MNLLLLMISLPLSAAAPTPDYDHETFKLIGWGDGCSAAVAHYGYPKVGQAIAEDPVMVRLGIVSMPPGETKQKDDWLISLHGPYSWRPHEVGKVLSNLAAKGYSRPDLVEEVGANAVVPERDLPRLLSTSDALKAVPSRARPDKNWRWSAIYYEPIATCALLLFERPGPDGTYYDYLLARIKNPSARADRALAHLTNGLLLLDRGDLKGALGETELSARLAPDSGPARYHHAAMMALSGVVEPTVDELEEAIKLDPQYKEKARKDKDFDSLRWHPKFKELTAKRAP
ncbi:MAG: hypothetical protein HY077_01550 [Elusimicrobia bacterium]|nr:hypothetical protein [Elusimicrobiota bacterium]